MQESSSTEAMSQERKKFPTPKRPYEFFGLNQNEALHWRIGKERFEELLNDEQINYSQNLHTLFIVCIYLDSILSTTSLLN